MLMILLLAFLPRKAADSLIMDQSSLITPWYSKMQGLRLLMLRWRSVLGHSDKVVDSIIAYKRSQ